MRAIHTILLTLALGASLSASAPALAGPLEGASLGSADLVGLHLADDGVERLEALALDASLTDARIDQLRASSDWRVRMNAGVIHSFRLDPEAARSVMGDMPEPTRAGLPRFMGQQFRSEDAAPVLLARYFGEPDVGTRYAIAEMLPRTQGDWGEAVVASWQDEESGFVRSVLVESIRHSEPAHALAVLPLAAQDEDWEVRAAAMRSIGWLEQGGQLESTLVAGLSDPRTEVRAFAARSLGWKQLDGSWDALRGALSDVDGEVRLRALRALQRIDAQRAAGLTEVKAMVDDADSKVARAAAQIIAG